MQRNTTNKMWCRFLYLPILIVLCQTAECQYSWPNNGQPNLGQNGPTYPNQNFGNGPFQYPPPNNGLQNFNNFNQGAGQNTGNNRVRDPFQGSSSNNGQSLNFFNSDNLPGADPSGLQGSDCGPDTYKTHIYSCLNNNSANILNREMSFPTTQLEVEASCRSWADFANCFRHKIQRCKNHKQFTQGLQISVNPLKKLCHDSKYQSEYLGQASCIKNVVETSCYTPYSNIISRIKAQDSKIINYCCDGLVLKQCAMALLKQRCSEMAGDILTNTLNFLSKCGNYRPNPPCPPVSGVEKTPDPRTNDMKDSRITNKVPESRIGNERFVEPTPATATVRPTAKINPYWPIKPKSAEIKKEKKNKALIMNFISVPILVISFVSLRFM